MGPPTGLPCWLRSVAEKSEVAMTAPVPISSTGWPEPPMVGRVAVPTTRRCPRVAVHVGHHRASDVRVQRRQRRRPEHDL